MPRRRVAAKREVLADPKYGSQILAKFMNHVMESGKKAVAERIVYGALDKVKERGKADPLETFEKSSRCHRSAGRSEVPPRRWCDLPGSGRSPSVPS
ncbi:30S ribosomal protein S7 [Pseudomonas aeruginosa]|nr:30S ribosomal protein S7 [Pseudomonas aeruginosa]